MRSPKYTQGLTLNTSVRPVDLQTCKEVLLESLLKAASSPSLQRAPLSHPSSCRATSPRTYNTPSSFIDIHLSSSISFHRISYSISLFCRYALSLPALARAWLARTREKHTDANGAVSPTVAFGHPRLALAGTELARVLGHLGRG